MSLEIHVHLLPSTSDYKTATCVNLFHLPISSQVNGIDLRQATHDEAIGVLRLTTQQVRLRVFRHQEAYREEDLWDVFSLELRPREGLGITTVGKWYSFFASHQPSSQSKI